MCNWKKWIWPGILATVILTALSTWFLLEPVQNDLTDKSLAELKANHPWAQVELDGRDLVLKGTAPNEQAQADALATTLSDSVYDVRIARDESVLPPIEDPYTFSAVRDGNKITLTGFYPSDEVRAGIVAKAQEEVPGAEIDDQMTLARGAAVGFPALAAFGLSQLGDLDKGTASISASDYSITGEAASADVFNAAIAAANGTLPGEGKLASAEILAPIVSPYAWNAEFTGEAIALSGAIPNEEARAAITARTREVLPDVAITDQMTIARTAPDGFVDAATYGLGFMPKFENGSISLSDADFSVKGKAKTEDDFNGATADVGNLPAGFNLAASDIEPAPELLPPPVSPYLWGADYDGQQLILTGFVPDEEERSRIIADAAAAVPNANIVDQMEIGRGAPEGYAASTAFSLQRMSEFQSGKASLTDSDLKVQGVASSVESYDAAVGALENNAPADVTLSQKDVTPATVSPYEMVGTKNDGVLTITGYAPSNGVREAIVGAARKANPDSRIVDRLQIANAVPQDVRWAEAGRYGFELMTKVSQGSFAIRDSAFSVEGMANSIEDFDSAKSMVAAGVPNGLQLATENIRAPRVSPYTWEITNNDGKSVVSGYVPDAETGKGNMDEATSLLGTPVTVEDQQKVAAGAPRNFKAGTSVATSIVSRLENAKATFTDTALYVEGEALTGVAANEVRSQVENALPPGFTGTHKISVRRVKQADFVEPDICQTLLDTYLNGNQILFETDKAIIRAESFGLIDRLVYTAQRCPTARIEIAGHTDSIGAAEYNQGLSESRANAVRDYLIRSGIFLSRLDAKGYGETQPVASNDTEEGKQKNRRIEFRIIK